jgi:hypothetical protein
MSQPIDWEAAARFASLHATLLRAVADADTRPLWYAGDVYGARYAPDQPKAPPATSN